MVGAEDSLGTTGDRAVGSVQGQTLFGASAKFGRLSCRSSRNLQKSLAFGTVDMEEFVQRPKLI